jgi:hypothetical protein
MVGGSERLAALSRMRHMGVFDCVVETRLSTRIRHGSTLAFVLLARALAIVLLIKFDTALLAQLDQFS